MKITDVEAIALRAPNPGAQGYWGSRTWASSPQPGASSEETARRLYAGHGVGRNYPPRWRMRAIYSDTIDTTIVKISTDSGLIGYGEAKAPVAPEVPREIVHQLLRPVLLGADPFDVAVLWEKMYAQMRLRGHTTGFYLEAISGVDIALWDLIGKAQGLPIHKLLGGAFREQVEIYASGLPGLHTPSDREAAGGLQRAAVALAEQGFGAIKLGAGFGLEADSASVEAVREALGADILLLVDAGGNYDVSQAIQVGRALESLQVGWFEAPLPPEHIDGYAQVAGALAIPVTSDLIVGRYMAFEYFKRGAIDIVQPDVCRSGGISECHRIAGLADAYGIAFAPHVSIGSAIQFAATAQVAAAVPNMILSEYWIGENPLGDAMLRQPLLRQHSHLLVPSGPGLGIDLDEQVLLAYAVS